MEIACKCTLFLANIIWRSGHAIRSPFPLDSSILHHDCRLVSTVFYVILSSKVSLWLTKGKKTKPKLYSADRGEPPPHIVRTKCYGNRNEHSYPFLTDFAIENKTQTRQTKHSVTGIFCPNLDLNTAGKKPFLSVFVEIFVWCTQFSFWRLNRACNLHLFSTTPVRCITTLGRACWR